MLRYLFIAFLFAALSSKGQLYINEFMASNSETIEDPDFNDDADWIEIYNAGTTAINLNGFFLTDDLNDAEKFRISNTIIPAGGFALFWADGMNQTNHTNFKLDALKESIALYNPNAELIDSVSYQNQNPDISMGRKINQTDAWGYFQVSTPNAANTTTVYDGMVFSEPVFSKKGGIYNQSQSLTLSTKFGGTIRYTTDGSEPTAKSTAYTTPIVLNQTTLVRSRIFIPNFIPGPIITNTFFIDSEIEKKNLPIVSIASNPENFWDPQTGIYVQDFKPDWEVPVNIELFENDGSDRAAFNEPAGIKINGLYSWQLPQKMLGVYFRKKYGTGSLNNQLFYDTPRSSFKTFALRASGSDWSYTLIRDILGQHAPQLNMDLDISAFRWCVVYINGQYMGIHNFREKIESDYIEQHYGLEQGTFDMVENEDYPECGNLDAYNELKALFSKDLTIQSNFNALDTLMDIEEFTDLVIAEMIAGNSSIDHNVMAWKPKDNGKWRWILMDLDRAFNTVTSQMIDFYVGQTSFPFGRLMQNQGYKQYFGKRLADHLYTTYNPDRMKQLITLHKNSIESEIPAHVERWLGTTSSYGNAMPSVEFWVQQMSKVEAYTKQRPIILLNDLTQYGFSNPATLTLGVSPANGGTLKLNGFEITASNTSGPYPKNLSSELQITEKAGYSFVGWQKTTKQILVPKKSVWKYLDNGTNQGTAWKEPAFDDSAWKSGQGELGYGDGDEATTINYGSDSQNKYICTYFRQNFELSATDLQGVNYTINLLRDDGAVVYVNGTEVVRDNISSGTINYQTPAASAVSGSGETNYFSYKLDNNLLHTGTNTLAVELHQVNGSSSDISFDLELVCYTPETSGIISASPRYPFTLSDDLSLVALFKDDGLCMLESEIASRTILSKACSPYLVQNDVTIEAGAKLTIEPGVEIWLSPGSNVFIYGKLEAHGTANEPIGFKINPEFSTEKWGALNFLNSPDTSVLNHVTIEDASVGPVPARVGAISAFYSNLKLNHVTLGVSNQNSVSARYSDVSIDSCTMQTNCSGDIINIKYGKASITNSTLIGNGSFDSDGIDYDGIENGIIKNTTLVNIIGDNADAIDIGEESKHIILDSLQVYKVSDKGISVGQNSSVYVSNSLFVACNLGAGVKDSSSLFVNKSIFYGNGIPIDCYEKNIGRAGGNAYIKNSILSNAATASYAADSKSFIDLSYTISDNDLLPTNKNNKYGNPRFESPGTFNFTLQNGSPCIAAGWENNSSTNLGAQIPWIDQAPGVVICQIYINPLNADNPEFISILNPSDESIDVSDYRIDRGVTCTIPEGTILGPGDTLFIASRTAFWEPWRKVVKWSDGKLSNNGEAIQLVDSYGIVADFIDYNLDDGWPEDAFVSESVLNLTHVFADNHFPEYWTTIPTKSVVSVPASKAASTISVYPNPAHHQLTVTSPVPLNNPIEIYTMLGQLVIKHSPGNSAKVSIDVSELIQGVYLIKAGNTFRRISIQ